MSKNTHTHTHRIGADKEAFREAHEAATLGLRQRRLVGNGENIGHMALGVACGEKALMGSKGASKWRGWYVWDKMSLKWLLEGSKPATPIPK